MKFCEKAPLLTLAGGFGESVAFRFCCLHRVWDRLLSRTSGSPDESSEQKVKIPGTADKPWLELQLQLQLQLFFFTNGRSRD